MGADVTCDRLRRRGGWAEDHLLHRCRPPIGPRNTWSNLAYAIVGFLLLWSPMSRPAAGVAWFAMTYLAIGSALYHATKTKFANLLDHVGMYTTFGALAAYAMFSTVAGVEYIMATTGVLFALILAYLRPGHLNLVMGITLGISLVCALMQGYSGPAWASIAVFGTAYGVWHLDKDEARPLGRWGHAIWHVLTAIAIGLMFVAQGTG